MAHFASVALCFGFVLGARVSRDLDEAVALSTDTADVLTCPRMSKALKVASASVSQMKFTCSASCQEYVTKSCEKAKWASEWSGMTKMELLGTKAKVQEKLAKKGMDICSMQRKGLSTAAEAKGYDCSDECLDTLESTCSASLKAYGWKVYLEEKSR